LIRTEKGLVAHVTGGKKELERNNTTGKGGGTSYPCRQREKEKSLKRKSTPKGFRQKKYGKQVTCSEIQNVEKVVAARKNLSRCIKKRKKSEGNRREGKKEGEVVATPNLTWVLCEEGARLLCLAD